MEGIMKKVIIAALSVALLFGVGNEAYGADFSQKPENSNPVLLKLEDAYNNIENNTEIKQMKKKYILLKEQYDIIPEAAKPVNLGIPGVIQDTNKNVNIGIPEIVFEKDDVDLYSLKGEMDLERYKKSIDDKVEEIKLKLEGEYIEGTLLKNKLEFMEKSLKNMENNIEIIITKISYGFLIESDLEEAINSKADYESQIKEQKTKLEKIFTTIKSDLSINKDYNIQLEDIYKSYRGIKPIDVDKTAKEYVNNSYELKIAKEDLDYLKKSNENLKYTPSVNYEEAKQEAGFQVKQKEDSIEQMKKTMYVNLEEEYNKLVSLNKVIQLQQASLAIAQNKHNFVVLKVNNGFLTEQDKQKSLQDLNNMKLSLQEQVNNYIESLDAFEKKIK